MWRVNTKFRPKYVFMANELSDTDEYKIALKEHLDKLWSTCDRSGMVARGMWRIEQEALFNEEYINNNKKKE